MFMPRRTLLNKNMFTPLGNLLYKLFRYILLLGISYVALFPIIKMVSASLSTPEDYYSNSSSFLPVSPTFDNFKNSQSYFPILKPLKVTLIVTVSCTLVSVFICSLVGYGLGRYKFKGSNLVYAAVLFTIIMPIQTAQIPLVYYYRWFDFFGIGKIIGLFTGKDLTVNLLTNVSSLLVPALFGVGLNAGIFIFLFRQFFAGMSKDLEEAAKLDGCSPFKIYWRVMLPNIIPTSGWGYDFLIGIDWVSTTAIIPWQLYMFYGDERPLRDNYDAIRRLVDFVERGSNGHITSWGLGDWIPVKTQSDRDFCATVYFYVDALILSKAAKLFGKLDDAKKYEQLAKDIRQALNDKYFDKEKCIYASGSQTELSMALYWGIVSDEYRQEVAKHLAEDVVSKDYHLDVGVHGCKALLCALSENGYADVAYRVAVQDTYPSWGAWIAQLGATTLRENWTFDNNDSDNHIMYGEIGAWPYKGLGGIYPDEQQPGFRHIILRPNFVDGLERFEACHTSPYGEIRSAWSRKGRRVTYDVSIPLGSTATWTSPDGTRHELTAGTHQFKVKL